MGGALAVRVYGFCERWVEVEGELSGVEDLRKGFEGRGSEFLCEGGAEIEYEAGMVLSFEPQGGFVRGRRGFRVRPVLDGFGCWGFAVFQESQGAPLPATSMSWRFESAVVDIEVDEGSSWSVKVWPG